VADTGHREPLTETPVPDAHADQHADRAEPAAAEELRSLRAEVERLRAEVERRDAALARLGERLVPAERARAEGAAEERERNRHLVDELLALRATKLYRYLLKPRAALYRYRVRRGAHG
jgi:hypothetical protein